MNPSEYSKQVMIYLKYIEIDLIKHNYTEDEIEYLRIDYINEKNSDKLVSILEHYNKDHIYFDSIIKPYRRNKRLKQLLGKKPYGV